MAMNTNENLTILKDKMHIKENNYNDFKERIEFNENGKFFEYAEKSTGVSHDLNDVDLYVVDMYEEIEDKKEEYYKDEKRKVEKYKRNYQHFIAGATAGFWSRTLTAPLERLKILYQVNYRGKGLDPPNIFIGIKEVYIKDGFKGLFRGNLINLLKATPDMAIKLYMFEVCKTYFRYKRGDNNLNALELFISGAIAGVIANFTIFPLDVIKTRISAAPSGTYNGIIDTYNKLYLEGGLKIFYKGVEASICCAIPNTGLQLCFYETLKRYFGKDRKDLSTIILMFMGGCSALISSTLLYPFQTIQSRIIMQDANYKKINYTVKYYLNYTYPEAYSNKKVNMITVIKSTFKNEGFRGFYKGYIPGITKVVLGNAISFGLYENIKKIINF